MAVACCLKKRSRPPDIRSGITKPIESSLIIWLVATSVLLTGCLSHIYVMPFLTYEPELILNNPCNNDSIEQFKGIEPLEKTLFHSFDNDDDHDHHHHHQHHGSGCEEDHKHDHQQEHVHEHEHQHDKHVEHHVEEMNEGMSEHHHPRPARHLNGEHHEHDGHDEHAKHEHDAHVEHAKHEHDHHDEDIELYGGHFSYHEEEPFCCMMWMKMLFMAGFALSQFTINIFEDKMNVFKYCIRALIVSGMIASGAVHVELFAIAWFIVAYTSSSTYLLLISHVLEVLDIHTDDWKWRLIGGLCFQMNWSISRLLADLIVYLSNEWTTVISVITILIVTAYFTLESLIWNETWTNKDLYDNDEELNDEPESIEVFWTNKTLYFNTVNLSFCWFIICMNFYGLLNSWCKISIYHMKLENAALSSGLGILGEAMGLAICLVAKTKTLPLSILQVLISITYFYMMSLDVKSVQHNLLESKSIKDVLTNGAIGLMLAAHLNMMLANAAFALLWIITVEVFPKKYRPIAVGFCSGIGRLGGILGIFLGEYKQLHLSSTVMFVMGFLTFVTAVFVKLLPDLTKLKMPKTLRELENIQFNTTNNQEDQRSNNMSMSTMDSNITISP